MQLDNLFQRIQGYAAAFATKNDLGEMTFAEDNGAYALVRPSGRRLGTLAYRDDGRLRVVTSAVESGMMMLWPLAGGLATETDLKSAVEWLMDTAKTLPP